ncbi:MAG: hypothetical protein ABIT01_11595 [Thermoanaerobaculia bacterium]
MSLHQTIGNVCVGIAGFLYVLPLQHLLLELSRKREDGGGALAGIIILIPMWLLLMAGLACVVAGGGFDWLRLNRSWLYALTVLATLALAVVSFARFEIALLPPAGRVPRILAGSLIHLFPLLTMLLVVLRLNPRLARGLPIHGAVMLPWTICAALSLAFCGGSIGYRAVAAGGIQVGGFIQKFGSNSELSRTNLARIPGLDPKAEFTELVRLADESQSRAVREAALAQLRRSPDFVASLVTELTDGSPSSGVLDHALALVEFAPFTLDEQGLLALPARNAMERITKYMRSELRHFPKDRRKGARRWGNRLFQSIATKLAGTGVDFRPVLDAFEKAFTVPDDDNG